MYLRPLIILLVTGIVFLAVACVHEEYTVVERWRDGIGNYFVVVELDGGKHHLEVSFECYAYAEVGEVLARRCR